MKEVQNDIEYLIAPYDAASRKGGSSNSLSAWCEILKNYSYQIIPREFAGITRHIIEHKVQYYNEIKKFPILVGGDHSLTYNACKTLTSIYGPLNIIVFDAHHDSYNQNYLNHYTVFKYCQQYLKANVYLVGCRKDQVTNPFMNFEKLKFPCYISVDVDYFSPTLIASVMDPVLCDDDDNYSFENFFNTLNSLNENVIVGADIMEWFGNEINSKEYIFMQKINSILLEIIKNKKINL